ncbi:phosphopantetheine-binding protein [Zymobacter palmae]
MLRTNVGGEPQLAAYLQGDDIALAALQAYAMAHLPDYMVPSAWVVMTAFPMTRNGKVDRRALPEPDMQVAATAFEPPFDDEEQAMAMLWQRLLGVERIGRHDDFFALGGHSLLAVRVVADIQQTQQVEVPVAELFEHSTLAAFTERVVDISIAQFDLDELLNMTDVEAEGDDHE